MPEQPAFSQRMVSLAGTLAIALAIGHVMQSGAQMADAVGLAPPGPVTPQVTDAIGVLDERSVSDLALTRALRPRSETVVARMARPSEPLVSPVVAAVTAAQSGTGLNAIGTVRAGKNGDRKAGGNCTVRLAATEQPAAMVSLRIEAPCYANARVVVNHDGLVFSSIIGENGTLTATIPAMVENATFRVSFEDGATAGTTLDVPSRRNYERVALQWIGRGAGLGLHALEFGAGYGDAGDVWVGASRDPSAGLRADGGFLTSLGNPLSPNPVLAQVYSYPAGRSVRSGVIRIRIRAAINDLNCGGWLDAQALQPDGLGGLRISTVSMSVPDCDRIGEYLELKNILLDMKIASN